MSRANYTTHKYKDFLTVLYRAEDQISELITKETGVFSTPENSNVLKKESKPDVKVAKSIWLMADILANSADGWVLTASLISAVTPLSECIMAMTGKDEIKVAPIPEINSPLTFKLGVIHLGLLTALNPEVCPSANDYLTILSKAKGWVERLTRAPTILNGNLITYYQAADEKTREDLMAFAKGHDEAFHARLMLENQRVESLQNLETMQTQVEEIVSKHKEQVASAFKSMLVLNRELKNVRKNLWNLELVEVDELSKIKPNRWTCKRVLVKCNALLDASYRLYKKTKEGWEYYALNSHEMAKQDLVFPAEIANFPYDSKHQALYNHISSCMEWNLVLSKVANEKDINEISRPTLVRIQGEGMDVQYRFYEKKFGVVHYVILDNEILQRMERFFEMDAMVFDEDYSDVYTHIAARRAYVALERKSQQNYIAVLEEQLEQKYYDAYEESSLKEWIPEMLQSLFPSNAPLEREAEKLKIEIEKLRTAETAAFKAIFERTKEGYISIVNMELQNLQQRTRILKQYTQEKLNPEHYVTEQKKLRGITIMLKAERAQALVRLEADYKALLLLGENSQATAEYDAITQMNDETCKSINQQEDELLKLEDEINRIEQERASLNPVENKQNYNMSKLHASAYWLIDVMSSSSFIPYLCAAAILIGGIAAAMAIGTLIGHPFFALFTVAALATIATPLCIAGAAAGGTLAVAGAATLMSYSLFGGNKAKPVNAKVKVDELQTRSINRGVDKALACPPIQF